MGFCYLGRLQAGFVSSGGPVVAIHSIGPYDIVEYHPAIFENCLHTGKYDDGRSEFHVYVDDCDSGMAATSLDGAILIAIDRKINGINSHAAQYACRVLGIPTDG